MILSNSSASLVLVAPFTGAWIEIGIWNGISSTASVAPFTGAWIEILAKTKAEKLGLMSLPSRERGLKYQLFLLLEIL